MLKPGRELDALIAENVMTDRPRCSYENINGIGNCMWRCSCGATGAWGERDSADHYPPYSTSIEAANQVQNHIFSVMEPHVQMAYMNALVEHAGFTFESKWKYGQMKLLLSSTPLTICLAAIKAVGE